MPIHILEPTLMIACPPVRTYGVLVYLQTACAALYPNHLTADIDIYYFPFQ